MNIDFYSMLIRRIPAQPDLSASSRGALYRLVSAATETMIAGAVPPLSLVQASMVRAAFDAAVKRIEAEFVEAREKHGRYAPDWAFPPEEKAAPPPPAMAAGEVRFGGQNTGTAGEDPQREWDFPVDLDAMRAASGVPQAGAARVRHNLAAHGRVISALLLRAMRTTAGPERAAYLWLTIEPLMQVGLVVSLYWMFGRTIVYNMPAVPFAILGVGAWLMFRTMLMRISTGLGREFSLCYFPGVSRLDVYLTKAMFFGISYSLATVAMLVATQYFGMADAPMKDPGRFLYYWVLIWIFSFGFAMIMNLVFAAMPSIKRMMLIFMRGIYLVSAVVVVTEQFSVEDKAIFLWNPLVHGMQLMRSAYFLDYESDDVSHAYFLGCTMSLLLLGIICERRQRRWEITP